MIGSTFGPSDYGVFSTFNLPEFTLYSQTVPTTVDPTYVYDRLKERVNLDDPLDSQLLEKPAISNLGVKHGGYGGFDGYGQSLDVSVGAFEYHDLILQWILQGAQNN